jgi:hypothetical protein
MEMLSNIPVKINAEKLKTGLHLDSLEGIQTLIETAWSLIRARAIYRVCYVEARFEDGVQIGKVRFTSRVLRKNLEKPERVFPYVVTIGNELEEATSSRGDLLEQYYFDVIGNLAVTAAREYLENHLKRRFALGELSRMSPGSLKDWPIQEQKPLFSMLGDVEGLIGVRLTKNSLMIPRKSVSGICFPKEIRFLSCQLCRRENCPGRQAGFDERLLGEYEKEG